MKSVKAADVAVLLLRLAAGSILAFTGAQKAFGVLGGAGFEGTVEAFAKMGFPKPLAVLAMAGELLGGLGLLFGVLTRLAAFGAACTMAVAAFKMATAPGVWARIAAGETGALSQVGFPLVLFAGAAAVMLLGGGRLCLDRLLFRPRRGRS